MRRSKWVVFSIVIALATWFGGVTSAEAKVYFDIYGSYKKITIAVPPFMSGEKERSEISDLLGQDLDMSAFSLSLPAP